MICFLSVICHFASAQQTDLSFLTTRAERTDFVETTRYDELIGFLEVAVRQNEQLHLTQFGYSQEGRALPLVVFGDVTGSSASEVNGSGKLRIFVQANIHGGEVCGKEALLMLIRDLASGQFSHWTDSAVLLLAPIYNADGNERISLNNRPRQNGPYGGMGQRANAQGLDLNRDHMKVKSPEARSLISLMKEYDPHVSIDLHTTNGTQHGYHLTYSPPLNPNTAPSIDELLRDKWLPAVTESIRDRYGWEYYYYGNLPFRQGREKGWYTFDHRPRFNNNYIGLRNRIAILSESYAYASFEERVMASYYFVQELIQYATNNTGEIIDAIEAADEATLVGHALALRAVPRQSDEPVAILMGATNTFQNPFSGSPVRARLDSTRIEMMHEYGSFEASEEERVPAEYYVDPRAGIVRDYLTLHGIAFDELGDDQTVEVEAFQVDSTNAATRAFQQINERTVFGSYEVRTLAFEKGTLRVDMTQPLARLAFYLLEPRSDDGLLNWAQLDSFIEPGKAFPIYRSLD